MCIGTCVYICICIHLSNPIYACDIYIYIPGTPRNQRYASDERQ